MNEFVDPFEAEEKPARKGPKRRPGPNDEQLEGDPLLGTDYYDGQQPEEASPLLRASDLLPKQEDPLAEIPVEPPDDDTPPDDVLPTFLVRRNRYGPGAHSVLFSDGTPVGVWLDEERHDADPAAVAEELMALGLEEDLALEFADRRALRQGAQATELPEDIARVWASPDDQATARQMIAAWGLEAFRSSQLHQMALAERKRKAEKDLIRAAFLEAHKKKQK